MDEMNQQPDADLIRQAECDASWLEKNPNLVVFAVHLRSLASRLEAMGQERDEALRDESKRYTLAALAVRVEADKAIQERDDARQHNMVLRKRLADQNRHFITLLEDVVMTYRQREADKEGDQE